MLACSVGQVAFVKKNRAEVSCLQVWEMFEVKVLTCNCQHWQSLRILLNVSDIQELVKIN